jgi:hypothetical protein
MPAGGVKRRGMRVRLKGIAKATSARGAGVYWYAWRGGPRLPGQPGEPEFMAAYNAAIANRFQPKGGPACFQNLIMVYKNSGEFDRLADRTKADYRKHIAEIEVEFGTMPIAAVVDRRARGVFIEWRDKLAKKSQRQAAYAWSVLARILSVAKDRGLIADNVCTGGGRIYKAERNDAVWSAAQEAAYYASAPDGHSLRLRQSKGGKHVRIPCGEPLRLALDAERASAAREDRLGVYILMTSKGRPWTPSGLSCMVGKARRGAGIEGVTFHDLRGSAVTRLALAGCRRSPPSPGTRSAMSRRSLMRITSRATAHSPTARSSSSKREQKLQNILQNTKSRSSGNSGFSE